jgi:hypothetical protein
MNVHLNDDDDDDDDEYVNKIKVGKCKIFVFFNVAQFRRTGAAGNCIVNCEIVENESAAV